MRNKIYAHIDKDALLEHEDLLKENHLDWKEIYKLIQYSIELLQFLSQALRCSHLTEMLYIYQNDLEDTLKLVRIGLETLKSD